MIAREKDARGKFVCFNTANVVSVGDVPKEYCDEAGPLAEVLMVGGRYFTLLGTMDEVVARLFPETTPASPSVDWRAVADELAGMAFPAPEFSERYSSIIARHTRTHVVPTVIVHDEGPEPAPAFADMGAAESVLYWAASTVNPVESARILARKALGREGTQ